MKMHRNKFAWSIFLVILLASFGVFAQNAAPAQEEKKGNFSVTAQMDNFLGFNFAFSGSYPINDKIDFTMVGTLFDSPNFGGKATQNVAASGTGLFAVIGPGIRFKFAEGKAFINPFLELANGALLSGGRYGSANTQLGRFLDGWVPGVAMGYKTGKFNARLSGAYFLPFTNKEAAQQLELVRITGLLSYQVSFIGVGLLYDYLWVQARPGLVSTSISLPYDDFMFVGPNIDFNFTKNTKLSFAFGPDFAKPIAGTENAGRSFYRVGTTLNF